MKSTQLTTLQNAQSRLIHMKTTAMDIDSSFTATNTGGHWSSAAEIGFSSSPSKYVKKYNVEMISNKLHSHAVIRRGNMISVTPL